MNKIVAKWLVDRYIEGCPDNISDENWKHIELFIVNKIYLNDEKQELRLEDYEGDGIWIIRDNIQKAIKKIKENKILSLSSKFN